MPSEPSPSAASVCRPLAGLRFALVGAGRVGASLGSWAVACGATAAAVAGRAAASSDALAAQLRARSTALDELTSAGEGLLLIAVSDPALAAVARRLARRPQAPVALHTSGVFDAEVLAPLRAAGCAVGSLHPLKAFPRPLVDPAAAHGCLFAVDGAPPALRLAQRLVAAWGGESVELAGRARTLYHLAATLAAGGVVTVLAAAWELAERLALPPATLRGYLELSRGALAQIEALGDPAAAITGPVARGDAETVERHRNALAEVAPELAAIVDALAAETRRQLARQTVVSAPKAASEAGPAGPEGGQGRR